MTIRIKRIYAAPAENDGFRVLVDRIWPRGMQKAQAEIDLWLKDIAPSPELRRWFGHQESRWPEFRSRYSRELDDRGEQVASLLERARQGAVTLLFAARDEERNNAAVLRDYLQERLQS